MASFFGGLGTITILCVIYFFGLPIIEASATELVSYTLLSLTSTAIFISHGFVNFSIGVALFLGMLVGGYLGAHIAVKRGEKWVKVVFIIVIMASALKILIK